LWFIAGRINRDLEVDAEGRRFDYPQIWQVEIPEGVPRFRDQGSDDLGDYCILRRSSGDAGTDYIATIDNRELTGCAARIQNHQPFRGQRRDDAGCTERGNPRNDPQNHSG